MAEIDVVNQRIENYTDVVEQIKTKIKEVADNKNISVIGGTDTPLSVLTKIDNGTIKTPTETISITSNGTVDVTNYGTANVAVEQALKAYAEGTMTTFIASDYGITKLRSCTYGIATMDLTGVTEIAPTEGGIGSSSITRLTISASTLILRDYAFKGMTYVAELTFDPMTNVTQLGTYCFAQFAANRSSPSSRIITMDFRHSTFTSIPNYAFSNAVTSSSTGYGLTYTNLYFPSTVASIGTNGFQGMSYSNLFFKNVPTAPNSTSGLGSNTCKYFFPYNSVRTARAASIWSSKLTTSNSYGWAEENTFETGDTLPATDSSGNILTWYSNVAMTSTYQITTVPDGSKIYYCKVTE